jgi:hypothetical protein
MAGGNPPDTPPDTPDPGGVKSKNPAPASIKGDVNYSKANITGSITAGHIYAYEVVLGE